MLGVHGHTRPLRQGSRPLRASGRTRIAITANAVSDGPSTSAPAHREYIIRRGTSQDAKGLAIVCAESFGRGNFPGVESEALDRLEERYANVIEGDMQVKLLDAMEAKQQAQREHRALRLQQYMQLLRAQLAALRGEPARFPTQLSPQEERAVQRWRRSRQFMILVAAERQAGTGAATASANGGDSATGCTPNTQRGPDASTSGTTSNGSGGVGAGSHGGSNGVVACATLSLMQPEALLPPPFPSNKPFRLYVSNMSVLPGHRRRGLARRLLQQCERVARLWGHTSIWLHVRRSNAAAAALYLSMGYRPVEEGGLRLPPGPLSQMLMCKSLPPLRSGCPVALTRGTAAGVGAGSVASGSGAAAGAGGVRDVVQGVSGASRTRDGVFVWNAVLSEGEGDASA